MNTHIPTGHTVIVMMNNKMSLRKVKGDFNRIFDKTLTDLVRGIRNNKENEVSFDEIEA